MQAFIGSQPPLIFALSDQDSSKMINAMRLIHKCSRQKNKTKQRRESIDVNVKDSFVKDASAQQKQQVFIATCE